MQKIYTSASRIVFILVSLTMAIAFLSVVFSNLKEEQVVIAIVALASSTISSAFTYYFTKPEVKSAETPKE